MKGVAVIGDRRLELQDFPDPAPGPGEVVLEIEASGMCGSDPTIAIFGQGPVGLRPADQRQRGVLDVKFMASPRPAGLLHNAGPPGLVCHRTLSKRPNQKETCNEIAAFSH